MERFQRHTRPGQPVSTAWEAEEGARRGEREKQSGGAIRTPKAYRAAEAITGTLLCFMAVFTPWAFGTTQSWSIWTMNVTAYLLGGILFWKWSIRLSSGFRPARWDDASSQADEEEFKRANKAADWLTPALATLTILLLAYALVSVLNARAIYVEWDRRFVYRDCINWLPHSYDRDSSLNAFWMYLGWACFFWASREWLLAKSARERHRQREHPRREHRTSERLFSGQEVRLRPDREGAEQAERWRGPRLPDRLKLLLWVLCLNGSLLALEAILQRLSGTDRLLWLLRPTLTPQPETQFGPYAYRANAAAYFNLLWPVSMGFWLTLRRSALASMRAGKRLGSGNYLVLLPGAVLMAACPIISTSRGGAAVSVGCSCVALSIILWATRKESRWIRLGALLLFAVILGFAGILGMKQLLPRFQTIFEDRMSHRTEIYDNAVKMRHDFPALGSGPATFPALYQLYRSPDQNWAYYAHDDWLELRIGFGWVGFAMILLMLGIVAARWFWGGGAPVRWELPAMIWVAFGGTLLHAKFDFPFQIYSIVLLFLLLAAVLFAVERPRTQS